jgi:Carboxypeptidase regulatory-like domain/TonB-dependent Receptor Plug Domain
MSRRAIPTRFVVNCAMLLAPTLAGAQQGARRARLDGVVRDSAGVRIRDAGVALAGENAPRSVSDDSGAFHITSLSPGRTTVIARRLGFRPETLTVDVLDGRPTRADFTLRAVAVQLESELVTADSVREFKMGAFNKRRGRGVGFFLTREDIEKRHSATVSELLRYVPGVSISQRMAGEPQPVHMQRSSNPTNQATCTVALYVDGNPYPNGSVDDFPPGSLEGIEVYRSASEIPAEFRTRDSMCGLIALWTRDPEAARRHP